MIIKTCILQMHKRVKQLTEALNKQSGESLQGQKKNLQVFFEHQFTFINGTNSAL